MAGKGWAQVVPLGGGLPSSVGEQRMERDPGNECHFTRLGRVRPWNANRCVWGLVRPL